MGAENGPWCHNQWARGGLSVDPWSMPHRFRSRKAGWRTQLSVKGPNPAPLCSECTRSTFRDSVVFASRDQYEIYALYPVPEPRDARLAARPQGPAALRPDMELLYTVASWLTMACHVCRSENPVAESDRVAEAEASKWRMAAASASRRRALTPPSPEHQTRSTVGVPYSPVTPVAAFVSLSKKRQPAALAPNIGANASVVTRIEQRHNILHWPRMAFDWRIVASQQVEYSPPRWDIWHKLWSCLARSRNTNVRNTTASHRR